MLWIWTVIVTPTNIMKTSKYYHCPKNPLSSTYSLLPPHKHWSVYCHCSIGFSIMPYSQNYSVCSYVTLSVCTTIYHVLDILHSWNIYAHMCIFMCMCIYVWVCMPVYRCVYTHIYAYTYTPCTHVHTYKCVHTHMYIFTYMPKTVP